MPSFILDPAVLPLQYPKANTAKPQKVRIVAQVIHHDMEHGRLTLTRVPNLPQLHTHIAIDGDVSETKPVPVVIKNIEVDAECLRKGAIVSIWGSFDGKQVEAWDCVSTNGQELLHGGAEVLAEASNLVDI